MDDQRISAGPALEAENLAYRIFTPGVCGKAVNRLGGHGEQMAVAQALSTKLDVLGYQWHGWNVIVE
jgi:hypothetical protein